MSAGVQPCRLSADGRGRWSTSRMRAAQNARADLRPTATLKGDEIGGRCNARGGCLRCATLPSRKSSFDKPRCTHMPQEETCPLLFLLGVWFCGFNETIPIAQPFSPVMPVSTDWICANFPLARAWEHHARMYHRAARTTNDVVDIAAQSPARIAKRGMVAFPSAIGAFCRSFGIAIVYQRNVLAILSILVCSHSLCGGAYAAPRWDPTC